MKEEMNFGKQLWDYEDVKTYINDFLELYEKRPIKNNEGGMSSTHLFWTWYVLKKLNPKNIIESGVWKGQGTWIIRQACPNAKIFSIDPVLGSRVYIDDNVTYFTEDFSKIEWGEYLEPRETFCFFDDHQDTYVRLQQMKWMGFSCAMFEDNYPFLQGDCYSLKKIFSQKDYISDNTVEKKWYPAVKAHLEYVKKNTESYTTFPPLFKKDVTRWGDCWNDENYPTPKAIFSDEDKKMYPILEKEAGAYTWICYIKLKNKV